MLAIPLKTADSYFTLFNLIAFPTKLSPNKVLKYSVEYEYFALQHKRKSYLLSHEQTLNVVKREASRYAQWQLQYIIRRH